MLAPVVTRVQVLRNENIFTFQLTANIGFSERRRWSQAVKNILGGYRLNVVSARIVSCLRQKQNKN